MNGNYIKRLEARYNTLLKATAKKQKNYLENLQNHDNYNKLPGLRNDGGRLAH